MSRAEQWERQLVRAQITWVVQSSHMETRMENIPSPSWWRAQSYMQEILVGSVKLKSFPPALLHATAAWLPSAQGSSSPLPPTAALVSNLQGTHSFLHPSPLCRKGFQLQHHTPVQQMGHGMDRSCPRQCCMHTALQAELCCFPLPLHLRKCCLITESR